MNAPLGPEDGKLIEGKPDNQRRACRAEGALRHYIEEWLGETFTDGDDAHVVDLLTDLMHYSRWKKIGFEDSLAMAQTNYAAEIDCPGCETGKVWPDTNLEELCEMCREAVALDKTQEDRR
ncbi:MAG: hypothetical protein M1377_02650 [Deltaproteobacteria bacterium]|nr:hypothetical protein [Deltaproteobacteria bacterium]